jgi:hypothetical protein
MISASTPPTPRPAAPRVVCFAHVVVVRCAAATACERIRAAVEPAAAAEVQAITSYTPRRDSPSWQRHHQSPRHDFHHHHRLPPHHRRHCVTPPPLQCLQHHRRHGVTLAPCNDCNTSHCTRGSSVKLLLHNAAQHGRWKSPHHIFHLWVKGQSGNTTDTKVRKCGAIIKT